MRHEMIQILPEGQTRTTNQIARLRLID
jgi:hypothetical protein